MALLPVAEAVRRILLNVKPLAAESVKLADALGRVAAAPVTARRDQPPFAASAMDGYAVRSADVVKVPVTLGIAGTSAAGRSFSGTVKPGTAIRIFTGAAVPRGADAVVIQENTTSPGDSRITVLASARPHQNVRDRGLDFRRGDRLIATGTLLGARDLGLAAAANAATLKVRRKPQVALFATGDELVEAGQRPRPDQIVSSNTRAIAAFAERFGATVINLGIVPDNLAATRRAIARAREADILVTTGGASVGDHDFIQEALTSSGITIDFWKIAMRPGKPFMYGRRKGQHVLGLPGNPVSALVCARLYLRPLLATFLGLSASEPDVVARLGAEMRENDGRQDYVRAALSTAPDGTRVATPFSRQDSSMQRTFREAGCLVIRPPHAPYAPAGSTVPIMILDF
jgi:molybdopterin molybdotransferase